MNGAALMCACRAATRKMFSIRTDKTNRQIDTQQAKNKNEHEVRGSRVHTVEKGLFFLITMIRAALVPLCAATSVSLETLEQEATCVC